MALKYVENIDVSISFGGEKMPVARLFRIEAFEGDNRTRILFEYDSSWLERGIELSPIAAPLKQVVKFFADPYDFHSLPGFIYENMPHHCWSERALANYVGYEMLNYKHYHPDRALNHLAYVGNFALGALIFEPNYTPKKLKTFDNLSLEEIEKLAIPIYQMEEVKKSISSQFFRTAGSMSGIRPKILAAVSKGKDRVFGGVYSSEYGSKPIEGYDPWIIKFTSKTDGPGSGAVEYVYALMAKDAGIEIPDVHLFTNDIEGDCGYFGCKRFDRTDDGKRLHMSCAIAMADLKRLRNLDYLELMELTNELCDNDMNELLKMYRIAVFNVLAVNCDDHSKNFSFLMDETGKWRVSPAYDLTFGYEQDGWHKNEMLEACTPCIYTLKELAQKCEIDKKVAESIIEKTICSLKKWPDLANKYGIRERTIEYVEDKINWFCSGKGDEVDMPEKDVHIQFDL